MVSKTVPPTEIVPEEDGVPNVAEPVATAVRTQRRMSADAVLAAIAELEKLLEAAKTNIRSRPRVSEALSGLSRQVLQTIGTANQEFQKEVAPLIAALAQAHIEALLQIDQTLGGERNPAHMQLLTLSKNLAALVSKPRMQGYNPLELGNLAVSLARKFDEQSVLRLAELAQFRGAGVYAIYYGGPFELYKPISEENHKASGSRAIYIGEAGRQGKRKGVGDTEDDPEKWIYDRLENHRTSIEQAKNLELGDFSCRYLIMEDLFIPLCESILLQEHRPLWNMKVEGFGNKHVGESRKDTQQMTKWDLLHPGRPNRAVVERRDYKTYNDVAAVVKAFFAAEMERKEKVQAGLPVEELKEEELAESPNGS